MSDRKSKRCRSPTSEETLVSSVIESGISFINDDNSSDSFEIPSSSEDEVDDTDDDPDFQPNSNGKSKAFSFLKIGLGTLCHLSQVMSIALSINLGLSPHH